MHLFDTHSTFGRMGVAPEDRRFWEVLHKGGDGLIDKALVAELAKTFQLLEKRKSDRQTLADPTQKARVDAAIVELTQQIHKLNPSFDPNLSHESAVSSAIGLISRCTNENHEVESASRKRARDMAADLGAQVSVLQRDPAASTPANVSKLTRLRSQIALVKRHASVLAHSSSPESAPLSTRELEELKKLEEKYPLPTQAQLRADRTAAESRQVRELDLAIRDMEIRVALTASSNPLRARLIDVLRKLQDNHSALSKKSAG